jgi:hypothetical protein
MAERCLANWWRFSLGYPDVPGFRAGTCHLYRFFDLQTLRELNLQIQPLIVMETTLFDRRYLGLSHEQALERILKLRNCCREVAGCFSLLWHNSALEHPGHLAVLTKAVNSQA